MLAAGGASVEVDPNSLKGESVDTQFEVPTVSLVKPEPIEPPVSSEPESIPFDGASAARFQSDLAVWVEETPWLQRLAAECHDAIARERTFAEAAISVLDGELTMMRAEQEQLAEAVADLNGKLAASQGAALSDAPASAPERFCTPEEIVQRRSAEHASRVASLRGSLDAATNRRRDVGTRIALLKQERVNHWVLLKERARNLAEYHTRRAATYTRKLERRRADVHFVAPTIEAPKWATAEPGAGSRLPIAA